LSWDDYFAFCGYVGYHFCCSFGSENANSLRLFPLAGSFFFPTVGCSKPAN